MPNWEPGLRIDLGCGYTKKEGTIGIDVQDTPAVDYVVDLEKEALPFADHSVSYVHSSHFLEHTLDPTPIFAEISRVCSNNARLELWTPYGWSNSAFVLGHKIFLSEEIYLHMCVWFLDFWQKILGARWLLNEIQYVVDPRTLCYLSAKGLTLDFGLRHLHNVAKEFCAHITVLHGDPAAPSPPLRRTFSVGRFEPRFVIRADQNAPNMSVLDSPPLEEADGRLLEAALQAFADGEPIEPS